MQLLYILAIPAGIIAMLVLIALTASTRGDLSALFWIGTIACAIVAGWAIDNLST
jgi:hypothetical protein